MKRFFLVAVCSTCALAGGPFAVGQDVATAAPVPEVAPQVVLTKLQPPVYPPLARQAEIAGDVKVRVLVRRDGSVESAEVVSGHPMLKQAALDSAQKSIYECRDCSDPVTSYFLNYTFGFSDRGCREFVNERRVRSAKCVYLWRCGLERSTSWGVQEYRAPGLVQAPGHVTILISSECLQTEISGSN